MTKKVLTEFVRIAFTASVGLPLIFASNAFAQLPPPAGPRRQREFLQLRSPLFAEQFFLPAIALVHRQRLQLIHDPRAHLHQSMPVPQQLSQIPILRTRYPNLRKVIFPHQPEYESRVLTVELLLLHSLGFDLRRIADPQLET